MNVICLATLICCVVGATSTAAADIEFNGFADARLIVPPVTNSYLDGGLGKLRFGSDDSSPGLKFGEIVGEARARLGDSWFVQADARISPQYGSAVDLLEAYAQFAPKSDSEWNWSVRAGAFFPPPSLENEQVGWSSFWTVTPSALKSSQARV